MQGSANLNGNIQVTTNITTNGEATVGLNYNAGKGPREGWNLGVNYDLAGSGLSASLGYTDPDSTMGLTTTVNRDGMSTSTELTGVSIATNGPNGFQMDDLNFAEQNINEAQDKTQKDQNAARLVASGKFSAEQVAKMSDNDFEKALSQLPKETPTDYQAFLGDIGNYIENNINSGVEYAISVGGSVAGGLAFLYGIGSAPTPGSPTPNTPNTQTVVVATPPNRKKEEEEGNVADHQDLDRNNDKPDSDLANSDSMDQMNPSLDNEGDISNTLQDKNQALEEALNNGSDFFRDPETGEIFRIVGDGDFFIRKANNDEIFRYENGIKLNTADYVEGRDNTEIILTRDTGNVVFKSYDDYRNSIYSSNDKELISNMKDALLPENIKNIPEGKKLYDAYQAALKELNNNPNATKETKIKTENAKKEWDKFVSKTKDKLNSDFKTHLLSQYAENGVYTGPLTYLNTINPTTNSYKNYFDRINIVLSPNDKMSLLNSQREMEGREGLSAGQLEGINRVTMTPNEMLKQIAVDNPKFAGKEFNNLTGNERIEVFNLLITKDVVSQSKDSGMSSMVEVVIDAIRKEGIDHFNYESLTADNDKTREENFSFIKDYIFKNSDKNDSRNLANNMTAEICKVYTNYMQAVANNLTNVSFGEYLMTKLKTRDLGRDTTGKPIIDQNGLTGHMKALINRDQDGNRTGNDFSNGQINDNGTITGLTKPLDSALIENILEKKKPGEVLQVYVDTNSTLGPNHYHMIIKGEDGVWYNMDHNKEKIKKVSFKNLI